MTLTARGVITAVDDPLGWVPDVVVVGSVFEIDVRFEPSEASADVFNQPERALYLYQGAINPAQSLLRVDGAVVLDTPSFQVFLDTEFTTLSFGSLGALPAAPCTVVGGSGMCPAWHIELTTDAPVFPDDSMPEAFPDFTGWAWSPWVLSESAYNPSTGVVEFCFRVEGALQSIAVVREPPLAAVAAALAALAALRCTRAAPPRGSVCRSRRAGSC